MKTERLKMNNKELKQKKEFQYKYGFLIEQLENYSQDLTVSAEKNANNTKVYNTEKRVVQNMIELIQNIGKMVELERYFPTIKVYFPELEFDKNKYEYEKEKRELIIEEKRLKEEFEKRMSELAEKKSKIKVDSMEEEQKDQVKNMGKQGTPNSQQPVHQTNTILNKNQNNN